MVSIIKETFNQLKPKAENKRLLFLRQELKKIIAEAQKDGAGSSVPMDKFEFEGIIESTKKQIVSHRNTISEYLNTLNDAENSISSKYNVSEYDIKEAIQKCSRCASNISSVQTSVYNIIERLCNRLHLSTTDVFNEQCYFPTVSSIPKMQKKTKEWDEKIEKEGITNKLKRFVGRFRSNNDWGYEIIHHSKTDVDVQATKDSICNYLKSAYSLYSSAISKWVKCVNKAIERLDDEIEKLRNEYKNRVDKALEAKVYLDVADKLNTIVNNISIVQVKTAPISSTNPHKGQITERKIPKLSYDLSKLAYVVNDRIHRIIFEKVVPQNGNPDNIIIGWDSLCLQNFIKRCIGKNAIGNKNERISIGRLNFNVLFNLSNAELIVCNNSFYRNIFVLISALQHGQALNQLANCQLNKFVRKSDNLFVVVQDFQEIMNAQVVYDALTSLRERVSKLNFQAKPTILIMHNNPIFNLAAIEAQHKKKQNSTLVQNDELTILHSLQKSSFGFLCSSPSDSKTINTIIQ